MEGKELKEKKRKGRVGGGAGKRPEQREGIGMEGEKEKSD